MVEYVFIDIETVPDYTGKEEYIQLKSMLESGRIAQDSNKYWKFKKGSLDPHKGRVIAITYQKGFKGTTECLKEWKSSEIKILDYFYFHIAALAKEYKRRGEHFYFVGFNIVTFDLPFLFNRMRYYERQKFEKGEQGEAEFLDHVGRRFNLIYRRVPPIDLLQIHLPHNDFRRPRLNHNTVFKAYGFETVERGDIKEWYYLGQYSKIEDYIKREFVYPALMEKIINQGLVSKEEWKKALEG